ncbi:Prolyl oligopeptidase family protein [Mucilaginibacter pineti]|uniref:Prolyl oligopeptidase family protein n=1 Tax=Mucilaginibacter pineti TaxID=1391627 RepID=A0A1G7EI28_9SPHI|nr:prolyl oligopeptidase family serine peptidase [Mucilaginibacter pineti]SDE63227.1 Prolyl oligopeptidase family protein [Mucilaginibacter pineti]
MIDYFGLSNFYLRPDSEFTSPKSGPGLLFGGAMTSKPDLVKLATPLNYIDSADPPFLILHGTKDELMDIRQSVCLRDSLKAHAVKAKLLIIKKAPHGGALFDTKPVVHALVAFLNKHLN